MNRCYGPLFAEIYDASGQVFFSLKMIAYLEDLLVRERVPVGSATDLACGTGTLACAFAQKGWRAYGVDASPGMLIRARQKAREMELSVTYVQAEMQSLDLQEPVDLITCVGDSLNYLPGDDALRQTFSAVATHLRAGGLFVFDQLTQYALEKYWGNRTNFQDDEDTALAVVGRYDPPGGVLEVTFTGFVRRGAAYEKFVERHKLRSFSPPTVTEALVAAGLDVTGQYDNFSYLPAHTESKRELWTARKDS